MPKRWRRPAHDRSSSSRYASSLREAQRCSKGGPFGARSPRQDLIGVGSRPHGPACDPRPAKDGGVAQLVRAAES